MKNIKKLLSIVMVLAMVLALGAQAFAAAEGDPEPTAKPTKKVDITIAEDVEDTTGAQYDAYRLLNLTTTEDPIKDEDGNEIGYAYTVNEKYRAALEAVLGITDEFDAEYGSTIVKKLVQTLKSAADVDDFANKMYAKIQELGLTPDAQSVNNKFAQVEEGYYLIFESTIGKLPGEVGEDETYGVRSKIIVDTAGRDSVTLHTKEDVPSVEKKVNEHDNAVATGPNGEKVGDVLTFTLTATLPSDYDEYDTYYLAFHDEMDKGLTMIQDKNITFKVVNGDGIDEYAASCLTVTPVEGGGTNFVYAVENLKDVFPGLKAGDKVVLTYTAVLNKDAEIRNYNDVSLEFSNRGGENGTGHGHTPKDTVVVFTFFMDGNKVDGEKKPLSGAGFTLYKKGADGNYDMENPCRDEVMVSESEGGQFVFDFDHLGAGDYKLVETTVPDGYNKAADIEFSIKLKTDDDGNVTEATVEGLENSGFEFTVKNQTEVEGKGTIGVQVMNQSGLELPETGGIGTTIFYVVGAILVVGAVILLVTRKRVSGASK